MMDDVFKWTPLSKAPGETDDQFKDRVSEKLVVGWPTGGAVEDEKELWWEYAIMKAEDNPFVLRCSYRFFYFYFKASPEEESI